MKGTHPATSQQLTTKIRGFQELKFYVTKNGSILRPPSISRGRNICFKNTV